MGLLRGSEEALYRFLALAVKFLHPSRVPYVLALFNVICPQVPRHEFNVIPAFRALAQVRAGGTGTAAALVFAVAVTVRGGITQNLAVRADVTVIVFVIGVFVFFEKTFLGHRTLVREQRSNFPVNQELRNGRRLVSRVGDQRFYAQAFDLVKEPLKGPAVVKVAGIDVIAQNPSVSVARGLHGVREDFLVFALVKPSAVGVGGAGLDFPFAAGSLGPSSLSLKGFLPWASRSESISFLSISS